MRLLVAVHAAFFAAVLAGCGSTDSSTSSGGGGESSVSSTSDTSSTTATGTGGATSSSSTASTTTTTTSSSSSGTGGSGGGGGDPTISATVMPDPVAAAGMATVTITVTNFKLVPPGPNAPGEGHYHIYLDNAVGGNYLATGQTPTKVIVIPAQTTPGMHSLRVNLTHNDHSPLSPPVETVVPFTVQ